jgi:outer membrane biogenesis lipoprotein LolB
MRIRLLLLLAGLALTQAGCSSTDKTAANSQVDSNGQQVSAVPWNKPENWETNGQLGSMTQ